MTEQQPLTAAALRLLKEMAAGAVVFAALNEPDHYTRGGAMFSELVGCRVWKDGKVARCVRSATIEPLYLRGLIAHEPEASGDRKLEITMAGYDEMERAR